MDFKEYLLSDKEINLAALANRMWPTNKSAKTYLSAKLNGKGERDFTRSDEKLARKCLGEMGIKFKENSKKKDL